MAWNIVIHEFEKWYTRTAKDPDVVSCAIDGREGRFTHYDMIRMWLHTQHDRTLDILLNPPECLMSTMWLHNHSMDEGFGQAVQDEVQERFERKVLGTKTDTDPNHTHGG